MWLQEEEGVAGILKRRGWLVRRGVTKTQWILSRGGGD
jgi:hypothetical protein